MRSALLIIDIQHALCTGEEAAFDIDRVVARINAVSAKARAAAAPVILIQHESPRGPLQAGSKGWELYGALAVEASDIRLGKTATDAFHKTSLVDELRVLGATELVVCGLQSEFCIDSTVRGALAHGYPVTLIADAHSTVDNGVLTAAQISAHHNATLANVDSYEPSVTVIAASAVHFQTWQPAAERSL
jgi:nicotinamidase-related amidase